MNLLCSLSITRSQAIARIADRTASQHLWGHVTIRYSICHFLYGGPLERSLYLQPFSRYCALSVFGVTSLTFQGHVTSSVNDHSIAYMPFPIGGPLEPSLYLTVSEIFNIKYNSMVDMTLIRPLNKCQGRGHSFRYQSISHIRLSIGCQ